MRANLITDVHRKWLQENLNTTFEEIEKLSDEELDKLCNDLLMFECDALDDDRDDLETINEVQDIIFDEVPGNMKEALKELTPEQVSFICEECSITEEQLNAMSEDELYDSVYDVLCDIEIAETPSNNDPLTARGQMAEDLVTLLGNTLISDDDFEDEDE